jgi:glutamyl-Q tRNA(Asp) synthetase
VVRQSARSAEYEAALAVLAGQGLIYSCSCSRGDLPGSGSAEARYPGYCRAGPRRPAASLALRLRTDGVPPITITDRVQPPFTQAVDAVVGDFVLKRRDGFYAYQLAVVVDDAAQGISHVVRGLDLYDNTPRQRLLQQALGLPAVDYLHLPLVVDAAGGKLSKSRQALAADPGRAPEVLSQVLGWLSHPPPAALQKAPAAEQLSWAVDHWNPMKLQGITEVVAPD